MKVIRNKMTHPKAEEVKGTKAFLGLALKIYEEASEVIAAPQDPEEYGDLLEAIYAFAKHNSVTKKQIHSAKSKKRKARGGFVKPTVLKT